MNVAEQRHIVGLHLTRVTHSDRISNFERALYEIRNMSSWVNVKDVLISLSLSFYVFLSHTADPKRLLMFPSYAILLFFESLAHLSLLINWLIFLLKRSLLCNRYRCASVFGVVVWFNFDSWVKCFSFVLVRGMDDNEDKTKMIK